MRRVAVFARPPLAGRVKTRLSPALPAAAALVLYRGMLEDAFDAARRSKHAGERFAYWAEAPDDATVEGLVPRLQRGADLGARLEAVFHELLAEPGDRAVVIGADAPELDAERIDDAFDRLERSPVVIAPATDGGYALIGLARHAPSLFHAVPWSDARTLEVTLERAAAAGLEVERLAALSDLDTPEDLVELVARAMAGALRPESHTVAALATLGMMIVP